MLETRLTVRNPLGLHARAAAQLVKTAGRFESNITITRADNLAFANAKSILSVLTLAASLGTELVLSFEGEDEENAATEIAALFANGFGEV